MFLVLTLKVKIFQLVIKNVRKITYVYNVYIYNVYIFVLVSTLLF